MIRMRQIVFALAFGLIFLSSIPKCLADQVRVRASQGKDFGRVVFIWEEPVSHKKIYSNKTLKLQFDRPIKASFQRLNRVMRKYIKRVRMGSDGRSVSFELTDQFETVSFDSGNAVIVEIAKAFQPTNTIGPQTNQVSKQKEYQKPKANAGVAEKLKKVRVRAGQHPNYSRVVIDWPRKIEYKFDQNDGLIKVRIGAAAELQIKRLKRRPPRFIGSVRSRLETNETIFEMAVAKTSQVRHFLSGSKLVLDVSRPTGAADLAVLPIRNTSTAEPIKKVQASNQDNKSGAEPKALGKAKILPIPLKPPKKTGGTSKKALALESMSDPKTAAGSEQRSDSLEKTVSPSSGDSREPSPRVMQPVGKPIDLGDIIEPPIQPPTTEEGEAGEPASESAETTPAPDAKPGKSLKFNWKETVAAAAFKRFGYLWVIFDRPSVIDIEKLQAAAGPFIETIDSAPTPEATILRFRLPKPINPELSLEGSTWILNIAKREGSVPEPININIELNSPVGPRMFFPATEAGKPLGITDPTSGDNLVVVPVVKPGQGVDLARSYPQLLVLPSFQGIVLKPLVDDIRIRPLRNGVELTSGSKLALSPVSPEDAARKLARKKPLTNILELEEWEVETLEEFNTRRLELQAEIAAARGKQRIAKRYNLARFYFSNRFGAETLGVLSELKREKPEIDKEPEFRLIRGGASYIMGRYSDAAADFTHDSLDGLDEGNFWRAAVVAKIGDLLAAAPALTRAGVFTKNYPKPLRLQMGTLVADAAVELGETSTAKAYIKGMKKLKPDDSELAEVEFVEGRLLEFKEDLDGAISKWEAVEKKPNKKMRARATISRLDLLLKLEKIDRPQAIKELEKLRFDWRGDELEFALLRRLGDLYLDEGLYRNGFTALRQAATYFPNTEEAQKIIKKMKRVFTELYLRDGADAMSAVTAIAVYKEFEELTPPGSKGDEMIRKLADRLVDVDLLDQAAEILEAQVKTRLNGELKSRVGARLAVVYLLSRRYDRALMALDASYVSSEPAELIVQRRHLRARALMGLEQSELVLKTLEKDKTTNADLLRAELFSNGNDWNNASRELLKIMRESGVKKKEEVNQDQAQKVLNYAIALVLAGNERALARVRRDYGAAVRNTNLKDAFQLVTSPRELGLINPSSARTGVKIAEKFKNFMSEYKKRLKEKGLSAAMSSETAETIDRGMQAKTAGG